MQSNTTITALLLLAISLQTIMTAPAVMQTISTVRLLSAHTGLYVQSLPQLAANAGDMMNDPESTKFVVDFTSNGLLTLRRQSALSQFLSIQEREDSNAAVTYTTVPEEEEEMMMGSGLAPLITKPAHTEFEYHYEHSIFSTVLRVVHSNGRYCYLAFEENGYLVQDPCEEDIDLYKARLMLVAFRENNY